MSYMLPQVLYLTHDAVQRLDKELYFIHGAHADTRIRLAVDLVTPDAHTFVEHLREKVFDRHLDGEEDETGVRRYGVHACLTEFFKHILPVLLVVGAGELLELRVLHAGQRAFQRG